MRLALLAVAALLALPGAAHAEPVHRGFESGLEGWTVTEGSFGELVTGKQNYTYNPLPLNKEGKNFLSTFEGSGAERNIEDQLSSMLSDNQRGVLGPGFSPYTGVVESPRFELTHPTISMLVAGGGGPEEYVAVCAVAEDGCRELARTSGDDGDGFAYRQLDVSEALGEQVFLRVVDDSVRGWSFVALDNVRANAPAMPRGFDAAHAELSWRPVDEPGVVGYDVWRSDSRHGDWTRLNDAPLTDTSFTDAGAEPGRAYWYRVAAVEQDGLASEANVTYMRAPLDPELRARGQSVVYEGDKLSGIAFPVGPVGYGGVLHLGDATRNQAWIFNVDGWVLNSTYFRRDARVPHSFFAVRAKTAGGEPVVRSLQTVAEGPFAPVESLSFRGEYPLASYSFEDSALPVEVTQSMESPTIPGDLRDSSIPTAIYTFDLENTSDEPVEVSLLATQQNAVGYDAQNRTGAIDGRRHPGYGANVTDVASDERGTHLHMTGCSEGNVVPVGLRCNGGLELSMLDDGATGTASWTSHDGLLNDFSDDGLVSGPASAKGTPPDPTVPQWGETVDGALSTTLELEPGEKASVPVVFSWYIPTSHPREFGGQGVWYSNVWDSAREVQQEVISRLEELRGRTHEFHDAVYDSNIPRYVLDRLTSQMATMSTPTVFWAQNGFLGGYEGHGCCAGMPSHVWQYAQLAPRLWPEIGGKWSAQWLDRSLPDGSTPNRHRLPTISFDGQAGVILGSYRYYLTTGDRDWLGRYWPKAKAAMDHLIRNHDLDEDGILTGSQGMTLDQRLSGTSSWLGSMYLAALRASQRMAEAAGSSADAARYERIFETGRVNQEQLLWNGEYYVEKPDGHPVEGVDAPATMTGTASYGNGVIADMLLGQWWATQLGLGDIYDSAHMTEAMRTLHRENFMDNFMDDSPFGQGHVWRVYVRPTDAGLKMMTWPQGDRPDDAPRYHDEVWTGTEYSAAATMIQRGLVDEGLRVVRAAFDSHDGELRRDMFLWNCGALDGGGNPFGDDECGKWYARAMSNWSILLALQGFSYDAAAETIGFSPQWRPHDHRSFFSAGNAWGTFDQKRSGATGQTNTISVRSGTLSLRQVQLDAGPVAPSEAEVMLDGSPLGATLEGQVVKLSEPVELAPGQILEIELR